MIQLARNLAMEWTPIRKDGTGGIRVNCLSPGHILTPMVLKNFEEVPGLREKWEAANMSTSPSVSANSLSFLEVIANAGFARCSGPSS